MSFRFVYVIIPVINNEGNMEDYLDHVRSA